MAEEDDAEATAEAPAKKKKEKGSNAAIGPLLALLLVIGLGIAVAFFLKTLLVADDGDGEEDGTTEVEQVGPIWENHMAIELGEILANVKGERGRRYVKLDLQLWVKKDDFEQVGREEVIPSMRAAIQDELRSWGISDYEGEHIDETMRHQFVETLNKTLRDLFGEPNLERTYVDRVVFNYLVQ